MNQPIKEGSELEEADCKYMSDSSSSSQFSLRKRYLNFDKMDKLEPLDSNSAVGSKYYGNVNDTIEEEISDQDEKVETRSNYLSSHSSKNKKAYLLTSDPVNPLSLQFVRAKNHRQCRSVIAHNEYETIQEEFDDYEF